MVKTVCELLQRMLFIHTGLFDSGCFGLFLCWIMFLSFSKWRLAWSFSSGFLPSQRTDCRCPARCFIDSLIKMIKATNWCHPCHDKNHIKSIVVGLKTMCIMLVVLLESEARLETQSFFLVAKKKKG